LQLICQRGARSSEEDQREQGSFHPRRFLKGHHAERNCTLIHNSHQRRLVQIKAARECVVAGERRTSGPATPAAWRS
jgi:hypothetical protein